jgi:hypothetical protein
MAMLQSMLGRYSSWLQWFKEIHNHGIAGRWWSFLSKMMAMISCLGLAWCWWARGAVTFQCHKIVIVYYQFRRNPFSCSLWFLPSLRCRSAFMYLHYLPLCIVFGGGRLNSHQLVAWVVAEFEAAEFETVCNNCSLNFLLTQPFSYQDDFSPYLDNHQSSRAPEASRVPETHSRQPSE